MPRARVNKPADETVEDTEGHRPSPRHDEPLTDTEGHARRGPAPSTTLEDDTEGHGRYAP